MSISPELAPWVEVRHVDTRRDQPHAATLVFDVVLRNQERHPMWFILPSTSSATDRLIDLRAMAVEVVELGAIGGRYIVAGRFVGATGFQVFRVAPGSTLRLRRVPIQWIGRLPHRVAVEVYESSAVTLGGEPLTWWIHGGQAATSVDVVEERGRVVGTRRAHDLEPLPIAMSGPGRVVLDVPLRRI